MDKVALFMGYAVMLIGGVAVVLAMLWIVAEALWKWWVNGLNTLDLMEATAEWRKNHPDKFAKWKQTNGVDV